MKLPLKDFSEIVGRLRASAPSTQSEGRSASRMEVMARVSAHIVEGTTIKRSYSLLMRDISLTGMGVFQSLALSPHTEIVLELPRHADPLLVCGSVTHCINIADGIVSLGIVFTSLANAELSALLAKHRADEQARVQRAMIQ